MNARLRLWAGWCGVHSSRGCWGILLCFVACRCIYGRVFWGKIFAVSTRRGAVKFTLWTCCLGESFQAVGWGAGRGALLGIRKGVGRTHKDPPLMFRVLYLARPRTGTRSFMVDAGEMKSHRPCIWCLLARFSRLFPPALSGSDVRLKETGGKRRKLVFPERLRGTWRCPRPAA